MGSPFSTSPKKLVSARSLRNSASVQVQVASSGRPMPEAFDQSVEKRVSRPCARRVAAEHFADVAGSAAGGRAYADQVFEVVDEPEYFNGTQRAVVAEARLPVGRLFLLGVRVRRRCGKALVHAEDQVELVGQGVAGTDAGDYHGQIVAARAAHVVRRAGGRVVGARDAVLEARAAKLHVLDAYAGTQGQPADFHGVVNPCCQCLGLFDAVAGVAEQPEIVQHQTAVDLGVGALSLVSVFLVFVIAQTHTQPVRNGAGIEKNSGFALHAAGIIFAVVVADFDCALRGIKSAVQDALQFGCAEAPERFAAVDGLDHVEPAGARKVLGVLAAVEIDTLCLVSGALVLVVVSGCPQL